MEELRLGNIIDLAKQYCSTNGAKQFLEELMKFEKRDPYSYKTEIREMLKKYKDIK